MAIAGYFRPAFFFTALGLAMAAALGWFYTGHWFGAGRFLFIAAVLAVLEISLSFDNAIVNARILRDMAEPWQRRFLSWGIIIAVFGMRIVFPLLIVAAAAHINPFAAFKLALFQPQDYAHIMAEAHLSIAAFGGTFLLMVGLSFFFDSNKDTHWIKLIETGAQKMAKARGVETAITILIIIFFSSFMAEGEQTAFMTAALYGLLTYIGLGALGAFLDKSKEEVNALKKAGLGAFLYLEVLDAAFSFDGVIGAFALSDNIFIIAIGLGIGAFYVRSLTIMLVARQNLLRYRYLEHGAFYAILALALLMYGQILFSVPEAITGLIGALFIGAGYISSLRYRRDSSKAKTGRAE
ncbi:MAG: DUF475 domain-containing protein [Candidatus Tokpelaia sp.]|nr:MAG: DUF475 domain-containing protein [Candidatus Tokpelaia sp.]KAA6206547.1 MAG: DUF475 domain-containing protein [Candidatus Tokpelaia sp.]